MLQGGWRHPDGGGSFGRAEFAVACLALEDCFTHDQPIAVLTYCEGLMTVFSNWVGEGKDLLLRHFPDDDILSSFFIKGWILDSLPSSSNNQSS